VRTLSPRSLKCGWRNDKSITQIVPITQAVGYSGHKKPLAVLHAAPET